MQPRHVDVQSQDLLVDEEELSGRGYPFQYFRVRRAMWHNMARSALECRPKSIAMLPKQTPLCPQTRFSTPVAP